MNAVKGILFNKKFIIILVVTAIFIGVAFWVYTTYVAPSINPEYVPNREFTDETSNKLSYLCFQLTGALTQSSKPVWKKLTENMKDKK